MPSASHGPKRRQGYEAPGFWAPALSEAQRRAEAGADWAVGDVANSALLGARVAMKAPAKLQEPKVGENMDGDWGIGSVYGVHDLI